MNRITFPLHPAQWDVYTDQLLNVDSPHYNIGGYIRLKGPVDKKKFQEAVLYNVIENLVCRKTNFSYSRGHF